MRPIYRPPRVDRGCRARGRLCCAFGRAGSGSVRPERGDHLRSRPGSERAGALRGSLEPERRPRFQRSGHRLQLRVPPRRDRERGHHAGHHQPAGGRRNAAQRGLPPLAAGAGEHTGDGGRSEQQPGAGAPDRDRSGDSAGRRHPRALQPAVRVHQHPGDPGRGVGHSADVHHHLHQRRRARHLGVAVRSLHRSQRRLHPSDPPAAIPWHRRDERRALRPGRRPLQPGSERERRSRQHRALVRQRERTSLCARRSPDHPLAPGEGRD